MQKQSYVVLGLDIGTTSVGWALVDIKRHVIIDMGVRIFPVGLNEDKYKKSHVEEPTNVARRTARGARRRGMRFKLRRKQLKKLFAEKGILPAEAKSIEAYLWRAKGLDEALTPEQFFTVLLHLNRRRGFKSNRKEELAGEDKDTGVVKSAIKELKAKIEETGKRTLGEYFYSLIEANKDGVNPQAPIEQIRCRYTARDLYREEAELLWEAQARFHPNIYTEEFRKKVLDETIFYQRPLKSQKESVLKCRFEPKRPVLNISHPLYQEFRMWQKIHDMRVTISTENRHLSPLTDEEKQKLFEALNTPKSLDARGDFSLAKMEKLLFNGKNAKFSAEKNFKFKGNLTHYRFCKQLGEKFWNSLGEEKQLKVWQTARFAQDNEWLFNYAKREFGFTEEQAEAYLKVKLEDDYGSISQKALRKILPFMRIEGGGMDYTEACKAAGYDHSGQLEQFKYREFDGTMEDLETRFKELILKPNALNNPLVQRSLTETFKVVKAIYREYVPLHGIPQEIRIETIRELKMPKEKREKLRSKMRAKEERRKENAEFLSRKLGKHIEPWHSEVTKYELWLELGVSERENFTKEMIKTFQDFNKSISKKDLEKYRLWKESNRISPFSGKVIPLSDLLSPKYEIEHIIPYSRSFDNSFRNKTLCESDLNKAKGNRTPYEFFQKRSEKEWYLFLERIKDMPIGKQKRMMRRDVDDGLPESHLRNTAYAAKEAAKRLAILAPKVETSEGQLTALLRRHWGLNRFLHDDEKALKSKVEKIAGKEKADKTDVKNRGDHRHHSIDALVVACTTRSIIQKVNTESAGYANKGNKENLLRNMDIHPPEGWGKENFRDQLQFHLDRMVISYRNEKRLLSTRTSRIKTKDGLKRTKPTIAVRGALHEETNYGQIELPRAVGKLSAEEKAYVYRRPLAAITDKQVGLIIDPVVRQKVQDYVNKYGNGKVAAAFKNLEEIPLWMNEEKGIPIKTVRVLNPASDLICLKPKENEKLFVASGSNFRMAIYEDPLTRERDYEIVTFFEAVQRKLKGQPVLPQAKGNKTILLEFTHGDYFVRYENSPEEIDWDNMEDIAKNRLYRVGKFTQGSVVIAHQKLSKVELDKDPEPLKVKRAYSTLKAIKVEITLLGKIIPPKGL